MNSRFLLVSEAELERARRWYERAARGRGTQFVAQARRTVSRIEQHPFGYGQVCPLPRGRDIREVKIRVFNYKIFYEVVPTEVVILAVQHGHSNRKPWRRRSSRSP